MPKLWRRLSSALSSAENSGAVDGRVETEMGASEGDVVRGVESAVPFSEAVELRGTVMGWMASAPNWASRKRNRRERRVEGSGVLWGFGCLKRWVRVGDVGGVWEWLWDFEDSVD
jgi:hypothetical protein